MKARETRRDALLSFNEARTSSPRGKERESVAV